MIKLKFSDFMNGNYSNEAKPYVLYVLTADACVIYIGISKMNVWRRWFDTPASHLHRNHGGEWGYNSEAGESIVRCLPDSLNWTIELWTLEDCISTFGYEDKIGFDPTDILMIEWLMINNLRPAFNSAGVQYQTDFNDLPEIIRHYKLADAEKRRRAHKEIFNKEHHP